MLVVLHNHFSQLIWASLGFLTYYWTQLLSLLPYSQNPNLLKVKVDIIEIKVNNVNFYPDNIDLIVDNINFYLNNSDFYLNYSDLRDNIEILSR